MTTYPRTRYSLRLLVWLFLCLAAGAQAAEWRWNDAGRVVAISDVHGAYPSMLRTLQHAGIVDESLAWQGAATHLVVTGDFLDRGPQSREVMDLLMRLEGEAAAAGGMVHVLLGNHEVMNLAGDLRYVSAAEYAAFAGEETADERERWFAAASARDPTLTRAAFDRAAPPGFFAHRRAFAPGGRYGAWLLQKPVIIVIDGTAFVHGGLSPLVGDAGLAGVNDSMRGELVDYVNNLARVVDAGLLLPTDNFYDHADLLADLPQDASRPPDLQAAIDTVIRLHGAAIHEPDSPVWYRGNVACSPLIEKTRLDAALGALDAKRVVIGHSPTPGRQVLQRLDGRVIEIDTGMLHDYYGGTGHALVIEGGRLSVVSETGGEPVEPAAHPWRVDMPGGEPAVHDLADWLAKGNVVSSTEEADRTRLTLEMDGQRIDAVFLPNPRSRGVVPELAAYRLDRLIGLGMVPLTVPRTVDGRNGVVQFVPDGSLNERERAERGEGAAAWCPLPLQWQAMYGFDVLTFNPGRLPETMRYGRADWQLMLVSHGSAFAPRSERPTYLRNTEISLDGGWIDALTAIDNDTLKSALGDVLDRRRLLALYQRRDKLLDEVRGKQ